MRIIFGLAFCFSLAGGGGAAHAQSAFFHLDGKKGERQIFIADVGIIRDRTPMEIEQLLGATAIKEMEVTVIYEGANSPEWSQMRLQFECRNKYRQRSFAEHNKAQKEADKTAKKNKTAKIAVSSMAVVDGWNNPSTWNDPVKMRLAEQSYTVQRIDISQKPIAPTQWQTVSSPVLLKAHKIACLAGEEDWTAAMKASQQGSNFDSNLFQNQMKAYGLTDGIQILGENSHLDLLDLAWNTLFKGTKRPDPGGLWAKKLSPAEMAKRDKEFAAMEQKMSALVTQTEATYNPMIEEMDAEREFVEVAAKFRDGRALSKTESALIIVWLSKPEEKVVQKMGNPNLKALNDLHILSYGQAYDNTQAYQDLNTGAVFEEGVSASCDVSFFTLQDSKGNWRVADVRVVVKSNSIGGGNACDGLLKVPAR